MFRKKSSLVALVAAFLLAVALSAGAALPAAAAHQPVRHLVLQGSSPGGGGGGKSARLYEPAHPVKIGKIDYAAAGGQRVSATRFAMRGASASCGYPQLCYHGGPVQAHPRVYLLFWGTWWYCTGAGCVNCPTSSTGCGNSDSRQVESQLYDYWHAVGLPGESHATITSQYYAASGAYPHFGSSNGVWGTKCSTDGRGNCGWVAWQQDPPPNPTADQIGQMASTAANYFGLQNNTDAQIVVLTPQGQNPDGFPGAGWCAWHSSEPSITGTNLSFTLMPWLPDVTGSHTCNASFGGLFGPNLDGWTEVGGHEFAESATDPVNNTGYYTPNPSDSSNSEIGDRCSFNNTFTEHMPDGTSFAQEQLWSNIENSCVNKMPAGAITGDHGLCVDNAGGHSANGNPIQIWTCNKTGAQQIYYTPSSGHLIVNGGCLDVSGASRNSGAKIIWYKCGTGANQKWEYDKNSHQWQVYRGLLGLGAMCLDDPNSSSVNGTQLQIYNCNSTAAQQWYGPKE